MLCSIVLAYFLQELNFAFDFYFQEIMNASEFSTLSYLFDSILIDSCAKTLSLKIMLFSSGNRLCQSFLESSSFNFVLLQVCC